MKLRTEHNQHKLLKPEENLSFDLEITVLSKDQQNALKIIDSLK